MKGSTTVFIEEVPPSLSGAPRHMCSRLCRRAGVLLALQSAVMGALPLIYIDTSLSVAASHAANVVQAHWSRDPLWLVVEIRMKR